VSAVKGDAGAFVGFGVEVAEDLAVGPVEEGGVVVALVVDPEAGGGGLEAVGVFAGSGEHALGGVGDGGGDAGGGEGGGVAGVNLDIGGPTYLVWRLDSALLGVEYVNNSV